jgi:hypothetical protein
LAASRFRDGLLGDVRITRRDRVLGSLLGNLGLGDGLLGDVLGFDRLGHGLVGDGVLDDRLGDRVDRDLLGGVGPGLGGGCGLVVGRLGSGQLVANLGERRGEGRVDPALRLGQRVRRGVPTLGALAPIAALARLCAGLGRRGLGARTGGSSACPRLRPRRWRSSRG